MKTLSCVKMLLLLLALLCAAALSACAEKQEDEIIAVEQKVIISEVMSRNSYFAALSDGSCCDWLELHNISDDSVNLRGYGLSDDQSNARRWLIGTDCVLQPGEYLVIYLSGYNGIDSDGSIHTDFKLSSLGESIFLSNSVGILTQVLEVPECTMENISYGLDERDTEAGYVWMAEPSPGRACAGSTADDPAKLEFRSNGVVVSEYMTDNTFTVYDRDSEYSDWLELYNPTDEAVPLAGCALSDNGEEGSRWYFPEDTVIGPGEYLLVFCSGKQTGADGELHASFRLGGGDTSLVLFSSSGKPVLSVDLKALPENVSCGIDQESGEWMLFSEATPGRANDTYAYAMDVSLRGTPAGDIVISETLAVSSGVKGDKLTYDYIELHNRSAQDLPLKGYALSDTFGAAEFVFPDISLPAGGYLAVRCTGTDNTADYSGGSVLTAAIKLDQGGETVYLYDPAGHLADKFDTGKQTYGVTRGRNVGDMSRWHYFTQPTPGKANAADTAITGYAPAPEFSVNGGAVDKGTVIHISCAEGCTVRYTTDGSVPGQKSEVYDPSKGITVDRTMTVRAMACAEGSIDSRAVTATFFVGAEHSLPVVCLTSDPDGLFSDKNGIYSYSKEMFGDKPNYTSSEERPCVMEYFVEGKRALVIEGGTRLFGEGSRTYAQKSLSVTLREKYGAGSVTFPFFKDNKVTAFSSLVLRQSGQECQYSKLRDELVAAIVKDRINCDIMDLTPAVLYINGEYWGLYYIREKLNEEYLYHKYGYDKDSLDIIKGQNLATAGSIDDYWAMTEYAGKHDLTKPENYEKMCSMLDKESLIDFWICETFFANNDTSNIRIYRTEGGKWRWMLFDLDNAFYPYLRNRNLIDEHLLDPKGHGIVDECSNAIIRKLLENDDFRAEFISRYCYHLKNNFTTERMTAILDEMAETIRPEMAGQAERWGWPTVSDWEGHVEDIREFMEKRPDNVKRHIKSSFGLSDSEFEKIYDAA